MDEKKRIIEFDAAESVPVDGQLPIDSASKGTKKITPALLLKAITDLLGNEALETLAQTLTGAVNEVMGIADDAQDLAENISDEYSATSAYAKGDYCIHNNTLYKCTTAIGSGGEAWNASHWSATKCDDELSELKQSLDVLSGIFEFNPTAYSGDMNDIKNPSCYFVTSSASNRPASGFWRLITLTFASAPTQIAISNDLTSMYLRNFTNGAWTAWSKFY